MGQGRVICDGYKNGYAVGKRQTLAPVRSDLNAELSAGANL